MKSRLCAALLCGLIALTNLFSAEENPVPITTAAEVLSLPAQLAGRRLPVTITGVVTVAEADWNGQFFVQDKTGGVFVESFKMPPPTLGDLVEIRGITHPGAFAPIVSKPEWRVLGRSQLPEAREISIETLESGVEDGLRVQISGVVRTAKIEGSRLKIDLAVGGFRLTVLTRLPPVGNLESLIAAHVRVRGTAATQYNAALRHLRSVAVYVPVWDDFEVIEAEGLNSFEKPPLPLDAVAQYRRDSSPGKRVHVVGTVTHQRLGEDLFLQDSTGGLRIRSAQATAYSPGEVVEAVGFLEYEDFRPLLRDGEIRKIDRPDFKLPPRHVRNNELTDGQHHAEYLTLRGKIVDRTTDTVQREAVGFSGQRTQWLIQGEGLSFTVEREDTVENSTLAQIPLNSIVEASGVCLSEAASDGKQKNLRLLLPTPADLKVLETPPWLNTRRLFIGLAGVCAVLAGVLGWSLTVSKKNAALSSLIREIKQAQRELQEAHDTLEEKVKERTAQLKVEMTARKTDELQFKAVLAERTRLARDLHDTLEQTLTGIALQLDIASKLFERSPEDSRHHLQLARNWLRQSQVELHRSIWDLRTRELEQFDLATALQRSAEQIIAGTDIKLSMKTHGEKQSLTEVIEENVLRIGQEALTNIIKYAQASEVSIELEFGPQTLRLRISDNGSGFSPPSMHSAGDNHFGLLGMSERAKRLAGRFDIESSPGQGTRVCVEIPLEQGKQNGATDSAASPS